MGGQGGRGPLPGTPRAPGREMVAAKSQPKLLTAQTCSWGGARSLRSPGMGVRGRFPQFHSPDRGGSWLGVPQNRSEGKRHSWQREQLVQRPGVEREERAKEMFSYGVWADFIFKHLIYYSMHSQSPNVGDPRSPEGTLQPPRRPPSSTDQGWARRREGDCRTQRRSGRELWSPRGGGALVVGLENLGVCQVKKTGKSTVGRE